MKEQAAYSLLVIGGKPKPTMKEVETLMKDVRVTVDKEALTALFNCLETRDHMTTSQIIEEGSSIEFTGFGFGTNPGFTNDY